MSNVRTVSKLKAKVDAGNYILKDSLKTREHEKWIQHLLGVIKKLSKIDWN